MRPYLPHKKGFFIGCAAALSVTGAIFAGSNGFKHFDHALYWYAFATVLTVYAIAYRFTIWLERPPTRTYFVRGLQILRGKSEAAKLSQPFWEMTRFLATKFLAQNFIRERSRYRWVMHLLLAGGCALSFAVVFPLVFGFVHFETSPEDPAVYHVIAHGFKVDSFNIHSPKAFVMFNMLNFGALIALAGILMAAWRRLRDAGERATQTFYEDIYPLLLLFTVTVTGLLLTVSYKFLDGQGHGAMSWVHMLSVILFLFYLPFGKLFHIFQRSGHLFVSLYKKAGEQGEKALCHSCHTAFASRMHVEDLKNVLGDLGFNYTFAGSQIHYADICPACRRRLLVLSQEKHLNRSLAA